MCAAIVESCRGVTVRLDRLVDMLRHVSGIDENRPEMATYGRLLGVPECSLRSIFSGAYTLCIRGDTAYGSCFRGFEQQKNDARPRALWVMNAINRFSEDSADPRRTTSWCAWRVAWEAAARDEHGKKSQAPRRNLKTTGTTGHRQESSVANLPRH